MPKKITTPCPPQRVDSASLTRKQLSMSCQLFITHTSPEGEIARSVCICSPPPTYPPGGEIWSPVLNPGGQFSVRTPQSCVIGLLGIAKLEIQTLSLPSTTTAQGPGRPPPVNGEPGYCVPSGRKSVTLPSLPFCLDMVVVRYSVADSNPATFRRAAMSTRRAMPSSPSPNRLVTQTLPWLSMLRPLLTNPVLKFSALLGFAAGKRVTLSLAFETQIRRHARTSLDEGGRGGARYRTDRGAALGGGRRTPRCPNRSARALSPRHARPLRGRAGARCRRHTLTAPSPSRQSGRRMSHGIYRRRFHHGVTWYIRFTFQGREVKERVGREGDGITRRLATDALKARLGDIARGRFRLPKARGPVLVREVIARYRTYAEAHHRGYRSTRYFLAQLDAAFGTLRLTIGRASCRERGETVERAASR